MKKIYVFGSFVMDHTFRCDVPPRDGESVFGDSFKVSYGGKGINQAMMIKRLGGDVTMVGCLGKDNNGDQFKKLLLDNGFDISKVFFKDVTTGVSDIVLDKNGQNRIIVILGANNCLLKEDILSLEDEIEDYSIFLIQNEIPTETIEEIVKLGDRKNATIVLNPAPYKKLPLKTINRINFLTPNENEAACLFGLDEYDEKKVLSKFEDLNTNAILITLGDKGSLYYDRSMLVRNKPFKVDVVDTVGAGDAFNGGFVYGLSRELEIKHCLLIANACGALNITKEGALVSQPSKEEVKEFLESQESIEKRTVKD